MKRREVLAAAESVARRLDTTARLVPSACDATQPRGGTVATPVAAASTDAGQGLPATTRTSCGSVLAVSSGGGHWVQLQRLRPALAGHDVTFASVSPAYRSDVPEQPFHVLPDATRWNTLGLVRLAWQVYRLVRRLRPRFVVTTGAAPGLLALRIGKMFGARTVWLDSMANVEGLSLSGRLARRHADLWLTQWPHLAQPGGLLYEGSVLSLEGADIVPRPPDAATNGNRILVTVGAQMPFDRLVHAVDAWAARRPGIDVLAQIGPTRLRPQNMRWTSFLDPAAFRAAVAASNLVVAHAGMGTILTALELGRPLLVLARRGERRETRNDHQVTSAARLEAMGLLSVAQDEVELARRLDEWRAMPPRPAIPAVASPRLLQCIGRFLAAQP